MADDEDEDIAALVVDNGSGMCKGVFQLLESPFVAFLANRCAEFETCRKLPVNSSFSAILAKI